MNNIHLGMLAGAITTAAGVPQVVKAFRTRHTRDISIWQPVLLSVGMTLWLIYGLLLHDLPLIVANGFSILCYASLIIMKLKFDKNDK